MLASRMTANIVFYQQSQRWIWGLDIYKSVRSSGDNWGPVQNLGAVINSSYNEETPFILKNGKRLYFSSFGHDNMVDTIFTMPK